MADRRSAEIFGRIFEMLAENPTEDFKTLANEIYTLTRDYSFTANQMYVDYSLFKLGLAKVLKSDPVKPKYVYKGNLDWDDQLLIDFELEE